MEDLAALSPAEQARFFHAAYQFLKAFETIHFHYADGLLDLSLWKGWRELLRHYVVAPGMAHYWEMRRYLFSDRFQEFVQGLEKPTEHFTVVTLLVETRLEKTSPNRVTPKSAGLGRVLNDQISVAVGLHSSALAKSRSNERSHTSHLDQSDRRNAVPNFVGRRCASADSYNRAPDAMPRPHPNAKAADRLNCPGRCFSFHVLSAGTKPTGAAAAATVALEVGAVDLNRPQAFR